MSSLQGVALQRLDGKNRHYTTHYDNLAQEDSRADPEENSLSKDEHDVDEEKKGTLFRRLYGILSLMSMIIFPINLIQILLLGKIRNWYWLVLFPGVIFLVFMIWAAGLLWKNRELFPRFRNLISFDKGLGKLAKTYPSKIGPEDVRVLHKRRWPLRLSRAGIIMTIIFNVIAVEFIYFPLFAVPAFETKEWVVTLKRDSSTPMMTPAVVVIQYGDEETSFRTSLDTSNEKWEGICKWASEQDYEEVCISDHTNTGVVQYTPSSIRYAIFDPRESAYSQLEIGNWLGLWYPFNCHGLGGINVTRFGFFDPALIPHFTTAYNCNLIELTDLSTFTWNLVDIQASNIHDEINAMNRTGECLLPAFKRFTSYQITPTYLDDVLPFQGPNDCNLDSPSYSGPCTGSIQINFPSGAVTTYLSQHSKIWSDMITDEGGVVGFVAFLTWFFGIFVS